METRRAGNPNGNPSPRHTILSRSALSDVSTPAPASEEVSRYQSTEWKWTAPSKSSRERTLCFYSFSLLKITKNRKKKKNPFFILWTPWTSDQWGDDTCMRAYELLKSGFQTWVALYNSIHYIIRWWIISTKLWDRGYFKEIFVEIRTCKSRVVAEVRSQTRRRQVKSLSRFRRGNFARLFAALKHFKNIEKNSAWFISKK